MRFPRFHFGIAIALGLSQLCMSVVPVFADGHVIHDIYDCSDLQAIRSNLSGWFQLKNDIDCTGVNFLPIGGGATSDSFSGRLDGQGYTISNVTINDPTHSNVGLFGTVTSGTVTNLFLSHISVTGNIYTGALAGYSIAGDFSNIGVENFDISGWNYIGGVFGTVESSTYVSQVFALHGTVDAGVYVIAGGMFGELGDASVSDVYVTDVTVTASGNAGGLIGLMSSSGGSSSLTNAYAADVVVTSTDAGGLISYVETTNPCSINNVFALSTISADGSPGGLIGVKMPCDVNNAAFNRTNDTPSTCVGFDYDDLHTECTDIDDNRSYFYASAYDPLASWDFSSTWLDRTSDFPVFLWLPPDPPTDVQALVENHDVHLTWTNPPLSDFFYSDIRRSTTGYPTGPFEDTPAESGEFGTSFTDVGLDDGVYFYSIFASDLTGHYSTAGHALAVVDTAPSSAHLCTPQAYLPFDALNGSDPVATDASGNGFHGSVTTYGTPALSSDVPSLGFSDAKSYAFTAADHDALVLNRPVQDDFTMCTWFKTSTNGTGEDQRDARMLLDAEVPGSANDFGLGLSGDNALIFGTGDNTYAYDLHGTTVVNTGAWTHACVTRRKSTGEMRIYLNGEVETAGFGSFSSLTDAAHLVIGGSQDSGTYWNGLMDDIRIYDSVLSGNDIRSIAQGTAVCSNPTPVTSSSVTDQPHQSSGGHRGNSTHQIVQSLEKKTASIVGPQKEMMNTGLRMRTCDRVLKWFRNDAKMLGRVNERLQKRFQFTCGK